MKQRPEWLDTIPASVSNEELDLELYKLTKRFDVELKRLGNELHSEQRGKSLDSLDKHKDKLAKYLDGWNQSGIAKLSEYVVHRRTTLDFISECLQLQTEGKYELEDVVHEAIFPMKATSDDVRPEQTNLWIIDERLAYHYYLASDLEFRRIPSLQVATNKRRKRTDLLVFQRFENRFDNPTVFVESERPFDSITVVEFKRPERDDYSSSDNPIDQVEEYVSTIKAGHQKDKSGRTIRLKDNTPFYAYIVCTVTQKLQQIAELRGFVRTPDGEGFIKYHPNLHAYEEIISYDKLLKDARRRNQTFFDKLNLPS